MLYLNGDFLNADEARIAPDDRGLLLGDGLFETFRAYNGRVFRLQAHLDRLRLGCTLLDLPFPQEDITAICAELLTRNQLRDAALRLTLTRGPAPRGVLPPRQPSPTLMITCGPVPTHVPLSAYFTGWSVDAQSPLRGIKSLNYLEHILARQRAARAGYDEALLLNHAGFIAEGSASTVFAVFNGVLATPRLRDGALPGVTRGVVLALARELGISVEERGIKPQELANADEVFLTNSLIEVQPLLKVGSWFNVSEAGDVTRQLQDAYHALVAMESAEA